MKTETFYARKIYNNRVSVQSSVVDYCKRLSRKLIVGFNDDKMLIKDLDDYTCDGKAFLARHTDKYIKAGESYILYDFYWAPVEQKHEVEGGLFEPTNIDHIKRMLEMKKQLGFK